MNEIPFAQGAMSAVLAIQKERARIAVLGHKRP